MAKKVKMANIASELGVSTVTVSKALSGQKGVSEDMREKIKELANQMGYKQPAVIKGTKRNESYNIGIIVPDSYFGEYESFYWKLYQEVATKAFQKECFTMLEVISMEDEKNSVLPKLIREKKVDGVILIGRPNNGYIQNLRSDESIPIQCLDFFDETSNCDAVISDGYYGTYMLMNYLFDMGHRDIAYVGTLLYTGSINDRYFGYCKAMMEHKIKVSEEWILDDRDWETGDVASFKFDFPEKMPTAFVCNCDLTASTLIKALREKGYRIPEDISVVGFDNYLYPGLCDIGITTYDVNIKEMARRSINMLLKKMNGEIYKSGLSIVEGNIVYKDSVAKLN
ncbi:MAG: substrate-binding domain-containing protein [Mobilitalea sp.]